MPRHFVTEPAVSSLVQDLVRLVLHEGSVNAAQRRLVATLAADKSEGWIYPNRLHTLLSDDGSKAINSETLDVVRLALSRLPAGALDDSDVQAAVDRHRSTALRAIESVSAAGSRNGVDMLAAVAHRLGLPPAAAAQIVADLGIISTDTEFDAPRLTLRTRGSSQEPDWTFQEDAHARCLSALAIGPNRKIGMVLPTGAGKTRVAMRIALSMLANSDRNDTIVLWVTHRRRLKTQAHRELQRALNAGTPDLPDDAVALLGGRVVFCMVSELEERMAQFADKTELVIVDEAHHAAAASYQPIFDRQPLRGLFLTATPNRTDLLPIGIDEVAYTTTPRELFKRGVILKPEIEQLTLDGFDWDSPESRRDLADYLLDRATDEFVKTLVAVSRVDAAEALYDSLVEVHSQYDTHVLAEEDLGFAHGSGTSTGLPPDVFLDEFTAQPRGILVATAQLLGEGFDDPSINTVVVTYPTTSMVQLMQAAGRCMRWTKDKTAAYVVQVKDSALAYHWEQRWLYQDISDLLRPQLRDLDYSTFDELTAQVEAVLARANVPPVAAARVRASLAEVQPGEQVSLLLTGLPYYGPASEFEHDAAWNAVLVTLRDRDLFLRVFNDFSSRGADVNSFSDFLRNYLQPDPTPDSQWKRYMDMLHSMSYARREIDDDDYDGAGSRDFTPAKGTTWLQYTSFRYEPAIPGALGEFLNDAVNRDDVAAQYLAARSSYQLAVKIPLPLAGTLAFVLTAEQAEWLSQHRTSVRERLVGVDPIESLSVLGEWARSLNTSPIPLVLLEHFDRLIREEDYARLTLTLDSATGGQDEVEAGEDGVPDGGVDER
jgi:superfamily II DNA or RNA helicase